MSEDIKTQLRNTMVKLENQLEAFSSYLRSLDPALARVFILPFIPPGAENRSIERIEVNTVSDFSAFNMGMNIVNQLFAKTGHSTKSALRMPGALCFKANYEQQRYAQHLADEINLTKDIFYQQVQTLDHPDNKFTVVHELFPMLITLNVYRTVKLFTEIQSVSFGWARKDSIQYVDRGALIKRLSNSLANPPTSHEINPDDWTALVGEEIIAVMRLPKDAKLKIQRPIPVQPIARVKQLRWQQVPCPTPLLILNRELPPNLNYLDDYDDRGSKGRYRKNSQTSHLIIPRLHLYASKVSK